MSKDNTIFDDVFRTMLERMPGLIIPVINEVFHTTYGEDEKIEQYRNEHHTASGEVIADSYIGIRDKLYHAECQSTKDSRMSIRMIEYDFSMALEHAEKREDMYELNFPQSCVLYLRHDRTTPEQLQVKVNMPGGEHVIYRIPTVKVQEYTRDEIFQKKLLFFLPFYIMRYEKELAGIGKEPARLENLVKEYEGIRKRLDEMLAGEEERDLYLRLMEVIKEIADYMLRREEAARERIGDIMAENSVEKAMKNIDLLLELLGDKYTGRQLIDLNCEMVERECYFHTVAMRMLEAGEPEDKILYYCDLTKKQLEFSKKRLALAKKERAERQEENHQPETEVQE